VEAPLTARLTCLNQAASQIHWMRLEDAVERARLDAQCATVGPAVILDGHGAWASELEIERRADQLLQTPPAPSPRPALVIVTWNTHVGGGDLPALVAALRRGDLTAGVPAEHFVLLLQEAFREGADVPSLIGPHAGVPARIEEHPPTGWRRDIVTTAHSLGLSLFYAPSMRNGVERRGQRQEDRGNAILSTLPISDFTAIELPFERQRRVALAATVAGTSPTGDAWRLRVATSHLDASADAGHLWVFASGLRTRQADRLAQALDDGAPTVVGSDLNTWSGGPREPAVSRLLRAFPDTPAPSTQPTFRSGITAFALDYMLFRFPAGWRGDSHRAASRFGSDHYPLVAEVTTR